MMKKLIGLLLVLALFALCGTALADDAAQMIINRDRVNVRSTPSGESMGRLACFTPVTVLEMGAETSLIRYPNGLLELWKENYNLKEYVLSYTGYGEGWVKTECLSAVAEGYDHLYGLAQDCRWETWTQGMYHKLHENGRYTSNKNYEVNPAPKVDGRELKTRTRSFDLLTPAQ